MMKFRGVMEPVGGTATLLCEGAIDLAALPEFCDAVRRLVTLHPGHTVAIDLDGVSLVDDTALGALMGAAANAREAGGELVVVCSSPRIRSRLVDTRLDRIVTVANSMAEVQAG